MVGRRNKKYAVLTAAIVAAVMLEGGLHSGEVRAATYIYTPASTLTDQWAAGTNWSAVPASDPTSELTFVGTNSTVLANTFTNSSSNNIDGSGTGTTPTRALVLNILDLQGTGPATGAGTITAAGNALEFRSNGAVTPVVNLNALTGTAGLTYNVNNNVVLTNNTTFQGNGTATFKFNGSLSGGGSLTKTGSSTMSIGTGTYSGATALIGVSGGGSSVLQTNSLATSPFGSNAAIALNNGTISFGTVGTGLTAGQSMNVSGYDLTFSGTGTLATKVASGTGVTVTLNSLSRGSNGGILSINPTSAATLGNTEKVLVSTNTGNVSLAVTNGILPASFIDGTTKAFLTYDVTNGFKDATTTTTFGTNNVVGITTNGQGTQSAYALRTTTNMLSTDNFTVGAGGYIGASGQNNAAGTLNFGATPAYIGLFGGGNYGTTFNATAGATFYGNGVSITASAINITGGITFAGGAWSIVPQPSGSEVFQTINPNALTLLRGASLTNQQSSKMTVASIVGDGLITSTTSASLFQITINGLNSTATTTFDGLITQGAGTLSLIKGGLNTQILTAANTYGAGTTINGGVLKLTGAGTVGTGNIVVNAGGTLSLDNGLANANRIADAATVALGGGLTLIGNSSAGSSETAGALTLSSAVSMTVTPGAGQSALMTFASASRNNGNTTLYRGTSLGSALGANTSNITFTTVPTVTTAGTLSATDGTGTLGGTNAAVLRGALFDNNASGNGIGFATYGANGVRLLDAATEQVTAYPGGASNSNVSLNLAGPTAITGVITNTLQLNNTTASAITVTNTGTALNPQNGLLFTGTNAITLGGTGTLTMPAGANDIVIQSTNTAGVIINTTLTNNGVAANSGVTIGGSGNVTLSQPINLMSSTATGTATFSVNGPGTVVLQNVIGGGTASTSLGNVTLQTNVNGGTLQLGAGGNLLGTPAALGVFRKLILLNVAAGATFDLNNNTGRISALSGNAGAIVTNSNNAGTPVLNIVDVPNFVSGQGTVSLSYAGNITGQMAVNIGANAVNTFDGFIQAFSGSNTYTGGTTLNMPVNNTNSKSYRFDINSSSAIGTGAFTLTAGTFDNTSAIALTLSTNNTQNWNGSFEFKGSSSLNLGTGAVTLGIASPTVTVTGNTLTIGGAIGDTGAGRGFTKIGGGTLLLSGINTYTGTTTVTVGALTVAATGRLSGLTAPLVVSNPNTSVGTTVTLNLSSAQTVGSLSGTVATPSSGTNLAQINLAGATTLLTANQTTNGIFAGTLAGTGGLTLGSGSTATLSLTGNNSYAGGTNINGGTLNVTNGALGTIGAIAFGGGTLQYSSSPVNTQDLSGRIANSSTTIAINTNGNNVIFASALSATNAGGLTKAGIGSLTLSASNSYVGTTTINGGSLVIANDNALGNVSGGLLINNGTLEVTAGFSTSRTLTLGTGSPTIQVDAGTYSVTTALAGSGTLTKTGPGTLALPALPVNGLTVSAGTLQQTPGLSAHALTTLANANLTVTGGKLDLTNNDLLLTGGAGQELTLSNNRLAAPTAGPAGSQVTTGILTGAEFATYNGGLFHGSVPAAGDLLLMYTYAGDVNFDGKITMDDYLAIDDGYLFGTTGWVSGDFNHDGVVNAADYALIDTNFSAQSGPLADGMIALHTSEFGAAYTDALAALATTAVPEPASLGLLALGAAGLLSRKNRR